MNCINSSSSFRVEGITRFNFHVSAFVIVYIY